MQVCSPSRAALLTGLPAVSAGVWPGVFTPGQLGGLSPRHPSLASRLLASNYTTYCVGKWHLGVGAAGEFLPTRHGFQHYLGVPYSHDMCPCPVCFPQSQPCHGQPRSLQPRSSTRHLGCFGILDFTMRYECEVVRGVSPRLLPTGHGGLPAVPGPDHPQPARPPARPHPVVRPGEHQVHTGVYRPLHNNNSRIYYSDCSS